VRRGRPPRRLDDTSDNVTECNRRVLATAFSPDGTRIATGGTDAAVKVWDAATGQEAITPSGQSGAVTGVAFSPDGRTLASASNDGTTRLWSAATGPDAR
jgi:WD40 repeat protein